MVLPIVTALSREVFAQTPATHKEGALALGATHWEMIRTAVLPFGRPGRHQRLDARPRPRPRRDHRRRDHPVSGLSRRPAGRWSVFNGGETFASQDRQQRRRVRQPAEDRRLHRRRPGAVRAHLRRQRDRPHRHRAQEGLHRMSTVAARRQHAAPPAPADAAPSWRSKSASRATKRPPRARRDVGRVLPRRGPAGLDPGPVDHQGRPDAARVALVDQLPGAASRRGASAAAPRTRSRAR